MATISDVYEAGDKLSEFQRAYGRTFRGGTLPPADADIYRYAPALRPPPAPQIAYGMRRSRLSLAVVLFASHLFAALAGAYMAAKAAEHSGAGADVCPVGAEAQPAREQVWL
jgi:hypothetical protein